MVTIIARAASATLVVALLMGCTTVPPTTEERDELVQRAEAERQEWKKIDPDMEAFVQKRYGFAFFPEVTKGGLVFGGAYGRGVVYEQGTHVGYADLTEGSFGLQIGGQTFSELIVFQDKYAFERFKRNAVDFGAQATAIVARSSASTNAPFVDGIAVFVRPLSGAMAEASIGGQRFTYAPK
ncbi:MAG TPA: lipid-binding SYLF domain-containing protein [Methylomirabilota bacterium]|nr:lipid-binding SYLF domain-containing protein [Methylomirabilota bacterium]